MTSNSGGLMRPRRAHRHERVTNIELFFDLVFVFAVTQLSHTLAEHLTLLGALRVGLLMMAVWWVWIYTAWVTNWLNPDTWPVRLLLFGLMLAGLVMSASLPQAFGARGLVFAAAYTAMQVGRTVFVIWAVRGDPGVRRTYQRMIVWLLASAALWFAGAFTPDPSARLALWAVALGLEYLSPSLGFWVPGLGRAATTDWTVEGAHLAERCGLFIIIALGESVLAVGATFAGHAMSPVGVAAFATAFIGSVAMWWIYFGMGGEAAAERIAEADDPGRIARLAYTYIHLPLVAGIIVTAVGDEMLMAHPLAATDGKIALVIAGGPAIYLLGAALFKLAAFGVVSPPRFVGIALIAALAAAAPWLSPLALAAAVNGVLILTAVWESAARPATVRRAPAL